MDADFNHPLVQLAGDWDSVQVRGHRRVDYWLVANSFGVSWGDLGGFFHIRRGTNECGLESLPTAGRFPPPAAASAVLAPAAAYSGALH